MAVAQRHNSHAVAVGCVGLAWLWGDRPSSLLTLQWGLWTSPQGSVSIQVAGDC